MWNRDRLAHSLRNRLLYPAVALSVFAVACQTPTPPPGPIVVDDRDRDGFGFVVQDTTLQQIVLDDGARVYEERCTPCHGETGRADGMLSDVMPIRPRNYHTERFKWGTRPSEIVETIRNGRSGVMPPFGGELSEADLWATAYLIWSWLPEDRRDVDNPSTLTQPPADSAETP